MSSDKIGLVVIGRNEGDRLKRCLRSIPSEYYMVYVDSGSNDDSVTFARSMGAIVVELDARSGFTAARARNAGWRRLLDHHPSLELIQFVDGDCEVAVDWFPKAVVAITADARLAAVFGRRRERFPERSIYNRMCDDEWNVPVGIVASCGGDAMFRVSALSGVHGYSDDLIAGEEPDLCLRLGRLGWVIQRIDAEMTLHDANILSFGSWWKRARRAGFAYAEHVWRHRAGALPSWHRGLLSIVFWGLVLPTTTLATAVMLAPFAPLVTALLLVVVLLIYALQHVRIAWRKVRSGNSLGVSVVYGGLLMIGKFAEASGALECWTSKLRHRQQKLIEYK
jgi:glycosyltransferase involved in cell wall biosynthesis